MVARLVASIKEKTYGKGIYFFSLNLVILTLVLISHLFYFNFYEEPNFTFDEFAYFNEINNNYAASKLIYIFNFIIHGYQTMFSLLITDTATYILTVVRFTIKWLWPLVTMYIVIILILTFLVDNVTTTF